MPNEQAVETGTRKSRKTDRSVTPQKSTSVAWFRTFLEWAPDRRRIAIDALEALEGVAVHVPEKQVELPGADGKPDE